MRLSDCAMRCPLARVKFFHSQQIQMKEDEEEEEEKETIVLRTL